MHSLNDNALCGVQYGQGTYTTEGVHPPGSTWAMIPMPTTALGPRCIPGANDTVETPHACEAPLDTERKRTPLGTPEKNSLAPSNA